MAVRLFDNLVCNAPEARDVFSLVMQDAPQRKPIVDALGCFGGAVAPLTETKEAIIGFFEETNASTPQTGAEWLARFMPPSMTDTKSVAPLAFWRRNTIAQIAYAATAGDTSFDAAVEALDAIHIRTLKEVFEFTKRVSNEQERKAGDNIALHIFEDGSGHLPGFVTSLGMISEKPAGEAGEAFARRFLGHLDELGDGVFAVTPDTSHRPGGVAGALVPDVVAFKSYVQSEAIASDLIMLGRARVIAGAEEISERARNALRCVVSGGRRADILFRDLDRARAQRMRRERAASEWDIDRIEGGRVDVELVISTLIYKHAPAHPFVQETSVSEALAAMARSDLITDEMANALTSAREFWARIQLVRAFAQWGDPTRSPVRRRFGDLIARAAGVKKFEQVRPLMRGYSDEVSRLYAHIVLGRPPLSVVAQAAG